MKLTGELEAMEQELMQDWTQLRFHPFSLLQFFGVLIRLFLV
jgi:hypothetical protein